jgi:hypothetical protein
MDMRRYVIPLDEVKTKENDNGQVLHHHYVEIICPKCGREFKTSKRKKPAIKHRPDLNLVDPKKPELRKSTRGFYLVPKHFRNGLPCEASEELV